MQFDLKSGHVDRYAVKRCVFPPCAPRPDAFATLEIVGEREGDRHPPTVSLFFDKPSDLDALIAEATALRAELTRQVAADIEAAQAKREAAHNENTRAAERGLTPAELARQHSPEELVANDA